MELPFYPSRRRLFCASVLVEEAVLLLLALGPLPDAADPAADKDADRRRRLVPVVGLAAVTAAATVALAAVLLSGATVTRSAALILETKSFVTESARGRADSAASLVRGLRDAADLVTVLHGLRLGVLPSDNDATLFVVAPAGAAAAEAAAAEPTRRRRAGRDHGLAACFRSIMTCETVSFGIRLDTTMERAHESCGSAPTAAAA
jgi:hypothetical protein